MQYAPRARLVRQCSAPEPRTRAARKAESKASAVPFLVARSHDGDEAIGASATLTGVTAVMAVELLLSAVVDELVVVEAVEWPGDEEQPAEITMMTAANARPADSQRDLGCPTASTRGPTPGTVTVP